MVARIFLCHASEDKAHVREIYHQLKALGFAPWLDEVDILPGQDWNYAIEQALETADFVMAFLSTRSVEKVGYVQREFRRALYYAEERPEGFIHTIPVKLDDCLVPRRFHHHQWVNFYESGAFDRIVRALHYGLQQRGQQLPEPFTHDPSSARSETAPRSVLQSPPMTGHLEAPAMQVATVEPLLTNSIGMEFVLIPAGTFMMGSNDGFEYEKPVHQVTISKPFYLGRYQATQAQWQQLIGKNPSRFTSDPNRPIETVSWEDVQAFIRILNEKEKGTKYRLPTEAEWEYVVRAGATSAYSFGDNSSQLVEYAWYYDNSGNKTHPVGQLKPNTWGLHDMHGNVWEWVHDWYGDYPEEALTDPQGPASGSFRVCRGGSWDDSARDCRSAFRDYWPPGNRASYLGFRLLRMAP